MELLFSNYPPINLSNRKSSDIFIKYLNSADEIQIASGYVSAAALVELHRFIEINKGTKVFILIGMHYFDLFTKNQYKAALELADYVYSNGLGEIKIARTFPFHGKMYSFNKNGKVQAAMIGSSNLSSLVKSPNRIYESDVFFEKSEAKQISECIRTITEKIGVDIRSVDIKDFVKSKSLLEGDYLVKYASPSFYESKLKTKGLYSFSIPLKGQSKSNMNVFFGKGRENKCTGRIIPRPWYEVEIIVPKKITSSAGYPKNKVFTVITDDGWEFQCSTNGTNAKNFRSKDDLLILGKWIKGRLEESGFLNVGQLYTDAIGLQYGRISVDLIATDQEDIWLLDYSV